MNFYRQLGELIFGTRLKRLSEKYLLDVSKIYKSLDIDFEPSWFPIFYLLNKNGEMSVTELAEELEITHQAISQFVNIFEDRKLIKFLKDSKDKRKRLICFTQKGLTLVNTIKPVWKSLEKSMKRMLEEGANSAYLLHALDELEDAMQREGIFIRVIKDIKNRQIEDLEIIHYESIYKTQFKNLMLSWLIENYNSDVLDVDLINYPEKKISNNGFIILMVKIKSEIVATIVVQVTEKSDSDILYLVVDEHWQRRQIGKKILLEVVHQLETRGVKNVHIELDRKFINAIKLFKSNGFVFKDVKTTKGATKSNGTKVVMELNL